MKYPRLLAGVEGYLKVVVLEDDGVVQSEGGPGVRLVHPCTWECVKVGRFWGGRRPRGISCEQTALKHETPAAMRRITKWRKKR